MASVFCYFKYCKWNPRKIIPTSKVWNPNSRNFLSRNLKNPKSTKLNFHKNLLPHSFRRCGNCERFCLSCNLSAFVSWFQQSHIREFRKFFGQESHRPPSPKVPVRLCICTLEGVGSKAELGGVGQTKKILCGRRTSIFCNPKEGTLDEKFGYAPHLT